MGQVGQIVLGAVGAVVGFYFGGPQGAMMGFSAGMMLGGLIFPEKQQGPRPTDLVIQQSAYGLAIPWNYSMFRQTGNVIWRGQPHQVGESSGGKGGPSYTSYYYTLSFAIGLCEGPIQGIRRIWANGTLIYDISNPNNFQQLTGSAGMVTNFKVYVGDESQEPDPTMESYLGVGNVPPNRGLAYVVFTNFSLKDYGGYLPSFSFEVVTGAPTQGVATVASTVHYPSTDGSLLSSAYMTAQSVTTFTWGYFAGYTGVYVWSQTPNGAQFQGGPLFASGNIKPLGVEAAAWQGRSDQPGFISRAYNPFSAGTNNPLSDLVACYFDAGNTPYSGALSAVPVLGIPAFNGAFQRPWFFISNGDVYAAGVGPRTGDGVHNTIYKGSVVTFTESGVVSSEPGQWYGVGVTASYVFAWDIGCNVAPLTVPRLGKFDRNTLAYLGDVILASSFPGGSPGTISSDAIPGDAVDDGTVFLITGGNPCKLWKIDVESGTATAWLSNVAMPYPAPQNFRAFTEDVFGLVDIPTTVTDQHLTYITRSLTTSTESVSSIVSDMCTRAGLTSGQYDTSSLTDLCLGYGVTNHSAMRDNIGPLQSMYFFDIADSEGKLKFVRRGGQPVGTFYYSDLGVDESEQSENAQNPIVITRPDELSLSKEYSVTYKGFQNDYNDNTQYAMRQSVPSNKRSMVSAPIVLADGEALARVQSMLWTEWQNSTTYAFSTDLSYMLYEPSDVVWLQDYDGSLYLVRLTKCTLDGRSTLKWEAVAEEPTLYPSATYVAPGGGAAGQTPQVIPYNGASMLQVLDVPPLRDQDGDPGLYVACGGPYPSWKGASVSISRDGTTFSPYAAPSQNTPMGYAASVLAAPSFTEGNEIDYTNAVTVQITNGMSVAGTTFANFLNGVNAALVGNEVVFFQNVVSNGGGSFTLSQLLRGRGGTESAWGGHVYNERFIALGAWLTPEGLSVNDLGRTIWNMAQTIALSPSTQHVVVTTSVQNGRVRPLSPTTLRSFTGTGSYLYWGGLETNTAYQPYGNKGTPLAPGAHDVLVTWLRRARVYAQWVDYYDVPLDESTESYQVGIWTGTSGSGPQTLKATVTVTVPQLGSPPPFVPALWFPNAQWSTMGFSTGSGVWFVVAQNSDQNVLGTSAQIFVTLP